MEKLSMKLKMRTSETIYIGCYILFIATCYIFQEIFYKPRAIWLFCPIIAIGVILSIVLNNQCTKKEMILRISIIMIFAIAAIVDSNAKMLVYAALLCGADMTSFRRIIKCSYWTSLIIVVCTMLLSFVGILPNTGEWERNGVVIWTFGFGYYSGLPYAFFYLVLEHLYLKKKKAIWPELIVIMGLNYIIYKFSTVRLTYYLIYLVIVLYIVLVKFNWFNLKKKFLHYLTILVYPITFIVSIWVNYAFTFDNPKLAAINKMLSDRLNLGHQAMTLYKIKLFGNTIETYNNGPSEYFYVDCGFLYSLLGYGLIFTGLVLVFYVFLHNYSARTNNKILFIWLTAVAAFSFSNNTWISIQYNPILLLFPIVLKEYRRKKALFGNAKSEFDIALC